MAAKASEDPGQVRGQIEMLRDNALGNFRDILVEHRQRHGDAVLARRPHEHARRKPQENFGREIMELFTMGVGHYTEPDVYAAARVFTGWNLARPGAAADGSQHYEFVYPDAAGRELRHRRRHPGKELGLASAGTGSTPGGPTP